MRDYRLGYGLGMLGKEGFGLRAGPGCQALGARFTTRWQGTTSRNGKTVRYEPAEWPSVANNSPFPRIVLLCPVEAYSSPNVRDGALRHQNRVLIWIDGHIPSRGTEFFLTDWMHGHRIG